MSQKIIRYLPNYATGEISVVECSNWIMADWLELLGAQETRAEAEAVLVEWSKYDRGYQNGKKY